MTAGRGALAVAGLLVAAAITPAGAKPTVAITATQAPASKKDQYLQAKVDNRANPPPRGVAPRPLVNLRNTWTDEWLAIDVDPRIVVDGAVVDQFLRDHYTNDPTHMDPRLIGVLRDAARHFHSSRIDIVSGFRAPKYNLMLRKKGHEVARDSQHTHGNAVDFRIPGVTVDELHAWALSRRLGGVGIYRNSKFVHMDVGPVRQWRGD